MCVGAGCVGDGLTFAPNDPHLVTVLMLQNFPCPLPPLSPPCPVLLRQSCFQYMPVKRISLNHITKACSLRQGWALVFIQGDTVCLLIAKEICNPSNFEGWKFYSYMDIFYNVFTTHHRDLDIFLKFWVKIWDKRSCYCLPQNCIYRLYDILKYSLKSIEWHAVLWTISQRQ